MRTLLGLVLAGLVAWSQPVLAECYGNGPTRTCVDSSGNVSITTETGNRTIQMDATGRVTVRTRLHNVTITMDQNGNAVTEMKLNNGSIAIGSNSNTGDAWSNTTIRTGGMVMTQSDYNGQVATELTQSMGGGYVVRTVTDPDGKTHEITCGPNMACP